MSILPDGLRCINWDYLLLTLLQSCLYPPHQQRLKCPASRLSHPHKLLRHLPPAHRATTAGATTSSTSSSRLRTLAPPRLQLLAAIASMHTGHPRRQALPAAMIDLRLDTLAISQAKQRRVVCTGHLHRIDEDAVLCACDKHPTINTTETENFHTKDQENLDDDLETIGRNSLYTPSSERHVRWSAELAEILQPSPASSKTPKSIQKLLGRGSSSRSSSPAGTAGSKSLLKSAGRKAATVEA